MLVIVTGVAMTFQSQGRDISRLLTTGCGVTIFIGFLATLIVILIGFLMIMPMGLCMNKIYRCIEEGEPNAEQDSELVEIITRLRKVERISFILVMIALASMPVARLV